MYSRTSLWLIVATALFALVAGCSGAVSDARSALDAGRTDEAWQIATNALSESPDDGELHIVLAEIAMAREKWSDAVYHARRGVGLEPGSKKAHRLLVQSNVASGRPAGLCERVMDYVELDAASATRAIGDVGQVLPDAADKALGGGRAEWAVSCYDALEALDNAAFEAGIEGYRAALLGAARLFVGDGRYFDAIAVYERLNRLPDSAGAYHLEVARLYQGLRDESARRDAVTRYLDSDPDADGTRALAAGQYLLELGLYDEAEPLLSTAASKQPSAPAQVFALVEARLQLADDAGARTVIDGFVPNATPDDLVGLAALVNSLGWTNIAVEILVAAGTASPTDTGVAFALAGIEHRREQKPAMLAVLEQLAVASPQATTLQQVGLWLLERDYATESMGYFRQASLAPEPPADVFYHLAITYAVHHEYIEMEKALIEHARRNPTPGEQIRAAELALDERSPKIAAAILAPAFDQDPSSREVAQLLAEAYDAERLPDKEHDVYQRWARATSDPGAAWLDVAALYERQGNDVFAEEALKEALQIESVRPEALYQMGRFMALTGQNEQALAEFDDYVAASSDTTDAWKRVFDFYNDELDDQLHAFAIADRAIASHPETAQVLLFAVGRARLERKELPEAVVVLAAWVDAHDEKGRATTRVVTDLRASAGIRFAVEFALQMRATYPEDAGVIRAVGIAYWIQATAVLTTDPGLASQLRGRAEDAYRAYVEAESDPVRLVQFGQVMQGQQLFELSVAAMDKAGDSALNGRLAWLGRGEGLVRVGRIEDARAAFEMAVAASETPSVTRIDAARTFAIGGYPKSAKPFLNAVIRDERNEVAINAFVTLGELLVQAGDRDGLRVAAKGLMKNTIKPFEARRAVAEAFARAGLYDDALESYRTMLANRPNAFDIAEAIAALGILRDDDAADKVLLEFAERSPTPSGTWSRIAEFYAVRGEEAKALEAYRQALSQTQIPDPALVLAVAETQTRLGQYAEATATFRDALTMSVSVEEVYARAIVAFRAAAQLQTADALASEAIDLLPLSKSGRFMLLKAEAALAAGRTASALQWVEEYRKAGNPLPPAVDLMMEAGSFEHARDLIQQELDTNKFYLVQRHTERLASRWLLYTGLDRMMAFIRSSVAHTPASDGLMRVLTGIQADAGRTSDALVGLGELSRRGVATRNDQELRFSLLIAVGLDREAMSTARDFVSNQDNSETVKRYRILANRALDESRVDIALDVLRDGIDQDQRTLFIDLVALELETAGPQAALDRLQGSEFGRAFSEEAPISDARVALECVRVLARGGLPNEAVALLSQLETAQGDAPEIDNVRIEALALAGDQAAVDAAVQAYLSKWDTTEHRFQVANALIRGRATGAGDLLSSLVVDPSPATAKAALETRLLAAASSEVDDITQQYVDGRFNRFRALMDVADILVTIGRYKPAARALRDASRVMPTAPIVFEELAMASYYQGANSEAVEAIESASRRRSNRLATLIRLADRFVLGPDSGVAESALRRAVELSPGDGRLQLELARQAYLSGDVASGDEWAEQFLANSDQPIQTRAMVVRVLLEANQVDRALKHAKVVLASEEAGGLALYEAGLALLRNDAFAEAISAFDRAIAVSLGPLEMQMAVAEAFRRRGQLDQVERYLEKAIEAEPDSPAPRFYRGLLRVSGGDVDGAMIDFESAFDGGWRPLETRLIAGQALLDADAADAAAAVLAPALNLRAIPAEDRLAGVLDTYADSGRVGAGLALVTEHAPGLLAVPTRRPAVAHVLVVALIRDGRVDEAREIAAAVTMKVPDSAWGWDALARSELALGNLDMAAEAAQRGVQYADDDASRARFIATLGRVDFARGDLDGAEARWLTALRVGEASSGSFHQRWTATVFQALAAVATDQRRVDDATAYRQRAARANAGSLEPEAFR